MGNNRLVNIRQKVSVRLVYHILLFVCQQQQVEEPFLVFVDFLYFTIRVFVFSLFKKSQSTATKKLRRHQKKLHIFPIKVARFFKKAEQHFLIVEQLLASVAGR